MADQVAGGIKNGHVRYPAYGGTQKKKKKKIMMNVETYQGQVSVGDDLEGLSQLVGETLAQEEVGVPDPGQLWREAIHSRPLSDSFVCFIA